ncbi:MAG: APC family permease [Planctomycetota bacterium]
MTERDQLHRVLGLGDVVLLGISSVIGSGIFLLPGIAAESMGPAALVPLGVAGGLCVLIALCFAEVSSRFDRTGGAYLFASEAFGGFAGFSVGWMAWWVRVIAWAALANGFALALLPLVGDAPPWFDEAVAAGLVVVLGALNLYGARESAAVMRVLNVLKLAPLTLFVAIGILHVEGGGFEPFAPHGYGSLADTTMLLLWAFVGFESIPIPAGEIRDPGRTVPVAILVVMAVVTVVYALVFVVAVGTYEGLAGSENPVAESASAFMGPVGATLVAAGIAISIFGTKAVQALVTPRCAYALAERRQAPAALGWVHANRRTPTIAILLTTGITLGLTLSGTFAELAVISVVGRFFEYVATCVAVPVFRARERISDGPGPASAVGPARFRLPLGPLVPVLATVLCLVLLVQTDPDRLIAGGVAFALGIPFYLAWGRRSAGAPTARS